jgi:hypothetical protein
LSDIIGIVSKTTKDDFLRILRDVYHLKNDEFVISESDEQYKAEINVSRDIPGVFRIKISDDVMRAYLSLYPPVNQGKKVNIEEIYSELEALGIKTGLKRESIKESITIAEFGNIVENVKIAVGVEPIDGKDAKLVKHYEEKIEKKEIKYNEKVDYRDITNIINVKEGELLITKRPPTKGVPGVTVKGVEISPKEGKDIEITILEGVREENFKYFAEIDGYVDFKNNKLAVYPLYKVKDVDYRVGNINFNGTVYVTGDVLYGFRIEAKKDVIVDGICDDCTIVAGERIEIKGGIKGKGKNLFKAKKEFVGGYIEEANIYCEGDIYIKKYSYNSNIYSKGKVWAVENRGVIAGGYVQAYSEIECMTLGARGVSNFTVRVGEDYTFEATLGEKEEYLEKINQALEKAGEALSKVDLKSQAIVSNPKIIKLLEYKRDLLIKRDEIVKDIEQLRNKMRYKKPKIRVKDVVYEGTVIQMYDRKLKIKERLESVLFFLEPKYEDIGWISLKEVDDFEQ